MTFLFCHPLSWKYKVDYPCNGPTKRNGKLSMTSPKQLNFLPLVFEPANQNWRFLFNDVMFRLLSVLLQRSLLRKFGNLLLEYFCIETKLKTLHRYRTFKHFCNSGLTCDYPHHTARFSLFFRFFRFSIRTNLRTRQCPIMINLYRSP